MATVLILLISCSDEEPKQPLSPPPVPKYISMSVIVSPPVILFGENATVLLDITNDGPDDVSLDFKCRDPFGFVLKSEDGSFTFKSFPVCFGSPHTIVLEAGKTRTIRMTVPSTLAPTSYDVSAGMMEYEEEYPWVSTRLFVRPR
jgi:hypothetical protein